MEHYIDADKLITEIERRKEKWLAESRLIRKGKDKAMYAAGKSSGYTEFLSLIDSLQQEQPEYGYLSTEYVHGKKPRWNVGDVLAYYLCTSNEEGEIVIGKIANVEFDDEEGWIYTFEDEGASDEQSLTEEGAYKITENGK